MVPPDAKLAPLVLAVTSALWVALTGLLMAVRLLRRSPLARNHGVG